MLTPPQLRLAHLPTPVESMPRLSSALGGPRLLVKRDDLTGLALGGNKTRKLEYLMAEAQANGAKTIITAGALQSNHCRQTAAASAHLGFECNLVLSGEKPTTSTGNLLLDKLFNAEIVWSTYEEREQTLQQTFNQSWQAGKRPYLIPYGGSNPTGAAAYVYAMQELISQNILADWIVFASSSGGTQAGMVAGARLFTFTGKVLGISVDEAADELRPRVAELASQTTDFLGEKASFSAEDVLVNDHYLGAGYGMMDQPEIEAIQMFARTEGLILDPVYTGRAAAGLVDLIRTGFFTSHETVLFWHTGGTPAVFSERYTRVADPL